MDKCLNSGDDCAGPVEHHYQPGREAFGLEPRAFPRCQHHAELAAVAAERTVRLYGSPALVEDGDGDGRTLAEDHANIYGGDWY